MPHTMIATAEDLYRWAVDQLVAQDGSAHYRYSLSCTPDDGTARGDGTNFLRRTYRSEGSRGATREQRVPLGSSFADELRRVWPRSVTTNVCPPQTVQRLLARVTGPHAVAHAKAEAWCEPEDRKARLDDLYAVAKRIWSPGAAPKCWDTKPQEGLGGRSFATVAADSAEGLEEALDVLAPLLDAAEPWAEQIGPIYAEFVTRVVASWQARVPKPFTLPPSLAPDAAATLVERTRPHVAEQIWLGRWAPNDGTTRRAVLAERVAPLCEAVPILFFPFGPPPGEARMVEVSLIHDVVRRLGDLAAAALPQRDSQ